MARIMLRVGFSTIRMGGIFNSICQQIIISNLKLLANDRHIKTITCRGISTNKFLLTENPKQQKTFVDKHGNIVKKKGKDSPKIAVINLDGSRTSMYLNEAEKIATLRRLDLVEVGVVADKKLYKFSDLSEFNSESESESESVETKGSHKVKKVMINSTILDHDLIVKINTIKKLLKKKNELLVEIIKKNTEESSNVEMITKKIRDEINNDYKVATSSSKSKFRLNISKSDTDEKKSNTGKSTGENEVKPKTNEIDKCMTGKQS